MMSARCISKIFSVAEFAELQSVALKAFVYLFGWAYKSFNQGDDVASFSPKTVKLYPLSFVWQNESVTEGGF